MFILIYRMFSARFKLNEEAVCVKTINISYNLSKSSLFNQFQSRCVHLQDQMVGG